MIDLIRDSPFGQVIRLVSKQKFLRYPEEDDPSLLDKYINAEKSLQIARTGSTKPAPPHRKEALHDGGQTTPESSDSQADDNLQLTTTVSGAPVDPEKGRNVDVRFSVTLKLALLFLQYFDSILEQHR